MQEIFNINDLFKHLTECVPCLVVMGLDIARNTKLRNVGFVVCGPARIRLLRVWVQNEFLDSYS